MMIPRVEGCPPGGGNEGLFKGAQDTAKPLMTRKS